MTYENDINEFNGASTTTGNYHDDDYEDDDWDWGNDDED